MESISTEQAICIPDNLSYSQLRTFRECRYKWYHYYCEGLRTRGHEVGRMRIGTLIHKGLEVVFLMDYLMRGASLTPEEIEKAVAEAIYQLHTEYLDELGELVTDEHITEVEELTERAIRITIRAIEWLDLDKWEVVASVDGEPLVECGLSMAQAHWKAFVGFADIVLKEKSTGNVYLIDAKCRDKFQTYDNEETNEQFPIYQKLIREQYGVEISGVITWQIKTREPILPEMTKKGELSRKKITTDWATYLQAIEAVGHDPVIYAGVKEWAVKVEFQRFSRNYRSEVEVANIWQDIQLTAKEMQREDLPIYRNLRPGFSGCHDCNMRELCLTELRGGDTTWIKKQRYRHKSEPNTLLPLVAEITLHE